ncbi:MAG TPA: hypothetical protein VL588_13265 [Bdellovibrionota bacterium]|nr:hypothetical protein [Bdellovibrionota bacterium]
MKRLTWTLVVVGLFVAAASAHETRGETVWYPMPDEAYLFGTRYPEAQRVLFAFDYGHALVYERLLVDRGKIDDPEAYERRVLAEIQNVIAHPPATKQDEADIAPNYVFTFPLVLNMMDWSHLLHQFVLDVLSTSQDRGPALVERVRQIHAQYAAKPAVAITSSCKSMVYMDGQYFSKAFRRTYPSLNLLIWSYHWFQIHLFEALMAPTQPARDQGVADTLRRFRALIADLPDSADFDDMPDTAVEAPVFSRTFPFLASAFDNNHMLHDIVSDILTSDRVADSAVRAEGQRMARMDLDPLAYQVPCKIPGGNP